MIEDKTFMMTQGSFHFRANFGLAMEHFKFWASSQTLSSFLKDVNFYQI